MARALSEFELPVDAVPMQDGARRVTSLRSLDRDGLALCAYRGGAMRRRPGIDDDDPPDFDDDEPGSLFRPRGR